MAEFAVLMAPQQKKLKLTRWGVNNKKLWRWVSAKLWKEKDPLRYMCALAQLVIQTDCDDSYFIPTATIATSHSAVSMTKGFAALVSYMSSDKEFKNISILTITGKMNVASFLLSEDVYVSAKAHINFHAVIIWLLGRFGLADVKQMPEQHAAFNKNTVVSAAPIWIAYLESILEVRLRDLS